MKQLNPAFKYALYGAGIMLLLCLAVWVVFAPTPFKSREDALKMLEKQHQHRADSLIDVALDKDKQIEKLRADSEHLYSLLEHNQVINITHIRNETTKKHDAVNVLSDDSLDSALRGFIKSAK